MTQAVAKQKEKQIAIFEAYTQEQIDLIKATVCKGATDNELKLFLYQADKTGLDPLSKQIHAVKRWDSAAQREVMSIQTGIDGYRLIADRTGRYIPAIVTLEGDPPNMKAKAVLKKKVDGEWFPVEAEAYYEEYVQTKKDGRPNYMWSKFPRLMLGKCSEALALRKAFPAELSGVYTNEEMGQADNNIEEAKVIHMGQTKEIPTEESKVPGAPTPELGNDHQCPDPEPQQTQETLSEEPSSTSTKNPITEKTVNGLKAILDGIVQHGDPKVAVAYKKAMNDFIKEHGVKKITELSEEEGQELVRQLMDEKKDPEWERLNKAFWAMITEKGLKPRTEKIKKLAYMMHGVESMTDLSVEQYQVLYNYINKMANENKEAMIKILETSEKDEPNGTTGTDTNQQPEN